MSKRAERWAALGEDLGEREPEFRFAIEAIVLEVMEAGETHGEWFLLSLLNVVRIFGQAADPDGHSE